MVGSGIKMTKSKTLSVLMRQHFFHKLSMCVGSVRPVEFVLKLVDVCRHLHSKKVNKFRKKLSFVYYIIEQVIFMGIPNHLFNMRIRSIHLRCNESWTLGFCYIQRLKHEEEGWVTTKLNHQFYSHQLMFFHNV